MIISSITKNTSEHYTIILDSGEEIKTTLGVITDIRLFQGKELDEEQVLEFKLLSSRALAREKTVEICSQRLMSSYELSKKLISKNIDEDVAEYCVSWAQDNGFIDNLHYAEAVVRHYCSKGYGKGRLKSEFIKRGIPRELWEDALSTVPEETDAIDRIIRSKLKDPTDKKELYKLGSYLYRRGFSWDEINSAVERAGYTD